MDEKIKCLEEAAKQFVGYDMDTDYLRDYEVGIQAFIAGANWQKEQMMKDAIGGTVWRGGYVVCPDNPLTISLNGDRVKIIIVKEEQK